MTPIDKTKYSRAIFGHKNEAWAKLILKKVQLVICPAAPQGVSRLSPDNMLS